MKRIPQLICLSFIFLTVLLSISCSKSEQKLDLSENISYYEADSYATVFDVRSHSEEFIPLKKENKTNLSKLLSSEENFLWLKIDFDLPGNMKYQSLGLFIGQLRSASEIWLNSRYIGNAGEINDSKFSNGFISHYYLIPERLFQPDTTNSLYIKLWTGPFGFISDSIYLTNPKSAQLKASLYSYFNSEIYISFGIMLIVASFFYLMLFLTKKVKDHNHEYLMFSLMTFSSFIFLIPFFAGELPWIKSSKISYLFFIKINVCFGAYFTTFFATSFVKKCLSISLSKAKDAIRGSILTVQLILSFIAGSFSQLFLFSPVIFAGIGIQIFFLFECLIKGLKNSKTKNTTLNILVGFLPVDVAFITDVILRNIYNNKAFPYFTIYGWGITVIVFLIILIIRFNIMDYKNQELTNSLKEFNSNLEQLVKKRTEDLTLSNQFLAEQVSQANEDLRTAKIVQQGLLPDSNAYFEGWDISVSYIPLNNVSGNFYDYYFTDNTLNGVGLFDVNEHGTSAGLLSIMAKSIIAYTFYANIPKNKIVSEILSEINRNIKSHEKKLNKYFNGILIKTGKINDDNTCEIEISSASIPDCIYYSSLSDAASTIEIESNSDTHSVIGSENINAIYNQNEIRMSKNDALVVFSNGLINTKNIQNINFDTKIICDILKRYKFDSAQRIQNAIVSALDSFIGNSQLKEDITIIVMKRI